MIWPTFKPLRVDVRQWSAANVAICIQVSVQPNRVALQVASDYWIVVSVGVVMRPRFRIVVLAGQYSNKPLPYRAVF
jgi:hypothetical protein